MITYIYVCLILFSSYSFSQNIFSSLNVGQFNVGFNVISLYDSSRTIDFPKGYRPLQIGIWYPGITTDTSLSLKYKDYFLLSSAETNFEVTKNDEDSTLFAYKNLLINNGIEDTAIVNWFNTDMLAHKEASPIKNNFPLVIIAQGNFHSIHHQAFLCEIIASHGYVVMTTPSQTRISGQLTDISQAKESANQQVEDIKFALKSLHNFDNIDFNNIALIGHSFGGRSILLLQMENENVKCLISLDGGLGLNTAIDDIKNAPQYNPEKMTVPLLHFYEDDEEFIKPDFTLINNFYNSNRFLVKIEDMRHFYFSSLGLVSGIIEGFSPASKNLTDKHKIIYEITLKFLDSILKSKNNFDSNKLNRELSFITNNFGFISYDYIK